MKMVLNMIGPKMEYEDMTFGLDGTIISMK